MPSKIVASSFALVGFSAAIVAGMGIGNPAFTTLWRAIITMAICYVVGHIIGAIGQKAISEHIKLYKKQNPISPVEIDQPEDTQPNSLSSDANQANDNNENTAGVDQPQQIQNNQPAVAGAAVGSMK